MPHIEQKPPKGITESVERAKAWMRANGAEVLVKNLAEGATEATLANVETQLGFPIPAPLKELWQLHDGQQEELNGFIRSMDLLSAKEAAQFRTDLLEAIDFILVDEDEEALEESERGPEWIPFAARDSDMLAVHAKTGRVWSFCEELDIEAPNLTAFFERYVEGMEAGEYTVAEGFGDVYLES